MKSRDKNVDSRSATEHHRGRLSLNPLPFDEAVTDVLKTPPPPKEEKPKKKKAKD